MEDLPGTGGGGEAQKCVQLQGLLCVRYCSWGFLISIITFNHPNNLSQALLLAPINPTCWLHSLKGAESRDLAQLR